MVSRVLGPMLEIARQVSLFSFFPLLKAWPLHLAILTTLIFRSIDRSVKHVSILLRVWSATTSIRVLSQRQPFWIRLML
ncbi:hypothetical protein CKAH01_10214 [Colletotrichum kahawae]|uniref:Uncharacterized protein n=1 Tax=Colletotrichum kahawae TaxID=34407 RepID=A0AAD9XXT7_COLKA|nr:hypothetical protein CKAH01_10214 [Colletotrichum kahawae]